MLLRVRVGVVTAAPSGILSHAILNCPRTAVPTIISQPEFPQIKV